MTFPASGFAQRPDAPPGTRSAPAATTSTTPAPVLTGVQPVSGGYALLGTGFGAQKERVRVFEGATEVSSAIVSVADSRIEVRSTVTGTVRHSVVVGGQGTRVVTYTHAATASALPGVVTTTGTPVGTTPAAAGAAPAARTALAGRTSGGSVGPAAGATLTTGGLTTTTTSGAGTPTPGTGSSTGTGGSTTAAPALGTLTLSPTTVTGGSVVSGTVTLSAPAPSGGAIVTLVHGSGTGPASLTVPAGQTSATFQTATAPVTSASQLTVQAAYAGVTKSAQVQVTPPATTPGTGGAVAVAELWDATGGATFSSGGHFLTLVNLTAPAPAGGAVVQLTTSHPPMTLREVPGGGGAIVSDGGGGGPFTLTIPAGKIGSGQFEMSLPAVATATTVTLGATYQGSTVTVQVPVAPASLGAVAVDPVRAAGGAVLTGTVRMGGIVAPGGTDVTLSYEGGLTGPSSIHVPAGEASADFEVTTPSVTTSSTARVRAAHGAAAKETVITLVPAGGSVASLTINRSEASFLNTRATEATLTMAQAASVEQAVDLASDGTAVTIPANVTIPAGQTTVTVDLDVKIVDVEQTVTITAGRDADAKSATLLVKPPPPLITGITAPERIVGGTQATGHLSLYPAIYNYSFYGNESAFVVSSDESVLQVDGDWRIFDSTTRLDVSITTEPVSTETEVTVVAGFLGPASVSKTILVVPHSVESLQFVPQWSIPPGGSTTGTVRLDAPAPAGGIAVELDVDDTILSVPPTVTVPQGQSTATFTATAGTTSLGATQMIQVTASTPGGTPVTTNVSVGENAHRE